MDVYVTADGASPATEPEAWGASYGAVTAYETLTPGRYTVAMRSAGAPAASLPSVSSTGRRRRGLGAVADVRRHRLGRRARSYVDNVVVFATSS